MNAAQMDFLPYIQFCLPYLRDGFLLSLKLFAIVLVCGFLLAIVIASLKAYGPRWLRWLLGIYTWIFRGTPLLLLLVLVYKGFPHIGLVLDGWLVATVVFTLSAAAYEAEIIRGGLISIDKGQFEAGHALGLTFLQTLRRIVVPQTVRRVLPPSCSEVIILFKDTSLVSAIAVFDLLRSAQNRVILDGGRPEAFIVSLVFYLVFSSILVIAFRHLEKRYSISL